MRFGSILGLGLMSALFMGGSPTGRITNLDPEPQPIRRRPRFQIKEPSGPVTDSTPMTKREKRRLRRSS